jgi:hypothetical protein
MGVPVGVQLAELDHKPLVMLVHAIAAAEAGQTIARTIAAASIIRTA